ncbi:PREDICTED: serine-rich adhesin for platelets-like [Gekko japonicus]|uniref:Serine-rich adhesin for platelets-like n=1 Tax=Gekko japonicus TaxID=146911 RepID=A0ABM1K227_GEKJA|nr:PREDICTED: serine-rich adhesin for platelets-like [Gekko japonicus]
MLANLKKRVQEGVCEVPPTMEVTQSSASLEDTGQSPLEVPEESIHGEQPLGNPRTDIGRILLRLQAGQESLLSEVAQLRTSVDQTNEQLQVAESRLSSLEHKACASQLTNSIMLALQSDPQAVPAASASSFSSQQMTLDAAQTAPPTSPSVYSGDTSSEPPLSSSEQFRNTSSTQGYSEIVEKAHQMHADAWSQEMNFKSETAHLEAEESDNQEDTSSRTSPLITPECETEPLTLTSAEETALPVITSVRSLERTSESGDAPIEPGPLSSSEQFRTTSSTRVYCETEEKAHQMLPDDWLKEMISESETARIKAEESDQPEVTCSEALSLNAPECETEPLTLTSTEEDPQPVITSVWSLERTSESETALARAEDSDQQEDTSSRALLSIAPEYEANPQPLKSTEEAALPVMAAVGSQETIAESKTTRRELEECDQQENNFSGRSAQAYMPEPQPLTSTLLETPQATPPAAMEKKAPGRDTQMSKRHSTNKRSSSTALNSTTTSAGTLRCLPSSAPADGGPPTKRCRQTSIAWIYFTKQPKNIATCRVCEEDVQTGKIGACGNVGTAPLLRHLEHKHKIPSIVWQHFKMWSKFSATCRFCKEIVDIGKIDCSRVGTASLLSHLTRKHGMPQEKVATSGMPQEKVATSVVTGAGSEMQDAERPSTTEGPSRTTSAASPSTTPSPGTLSHLPSSSPTEVRPPTKRRRTSIAWKYFTKWSKFKATCTICKEDVKFGKRVGCGNVDTAALHSHLRRKHGITREKVATSVVTGAGSEMQDAERPSTTEGPSRTTSAASPSTTPSPVKLSRLLSSSPKDVGPPTKRCRQTSIAWLYFTGRSKFIATCRVCEEDVQTGKIEACGNVGTAALLRHLEHKHKIPAIAWQHFKMFSKFSATCRFCKEIVNIGKIGCGDRFEK